MKHVPFCLAVLVMFLSLSGVALAHRVNVFAFVDGGEIQVECGFSASRKVRNGRLVVTDLDTGDVVLEGVTDAAGIFRFRPPDEFLLTGHGLNIRLFAEEGHQDDWKISPEELKALSGPPPSAAAHAVPPGRPAEGAPPPPANAPAADGTEPSPALDAARLETLVGRLLDQKLLPIKQALAGQRGDEPGLRDILGGIGWILGLLGLAAYMKYRR